MVESLHTYVAMSVVSSTAELEDDVSTDSSQKKKLSIIKFCDHVQGRWCCGRIERLQSVMNIEHVKTLCQCNSNIGTSKLKVTDPFSLF